MTPGRRFLFGCVWLLGLAAQAAASPQEPDPAAPEARREPEAPARPHFEPMPDRWSIEGPPYEINSSKSPWDPYNRNKLKGDYPVLGQDIFLNLTAFNSAIFEGRNIPVPRGITGPTPANEDFFGRGEQFQILNITALTIDLFKGQQAFKPVDWRLRTTVAANLDYLATRELGLVNINPADGKDRTTGDLSLQEATLEVHILDWNDRYDFLAGEAGIIPFRSDFRGFIFDDVNLGVRLFGNADDNKWQYNLAWFYMLEKDSRSELNTFQDRHQQVLIANAYRFDWPFKGWNQSLSVHWNRDEASLHFDRNDFLRRPAPIGLARPHAIDAVYFGWASDGHIGRMNISSAFYHVVGRDGDNPLAAREVKINAQMAALEVSMDFDWFRVKAFGLYASGDRDTRDGKAEGFDSILEAPNFAGGEFSFWNRQGIPLLGTFLTNRLSPFPNLQATKFEGQSNFVNPGILIVGVGADVEITPTLRATANLSHLWFMETDPLEVFLELEEIERDIGFEASVGFQYRPLLTNNIIFNVGASALRPGRGMRKIYESDEVLWQAFVEVLLTW